MNIVILSGSPRKGGNTEMLAESFAQGASSRHNVDFVSVRDYHVYPCKGCNSCFKREDKSCIQKDDMQTRLCVNFFHFEDCGKILVRGVKEKSDIKSTDALKEAFTLGASI